MAMAGVGNTSTVRGSRWNLLLLNKEGAADFPGHGPPAGRDLSWWSFVSLSRGPGFGS